MKLWHLLDGIMPLSMTAAMDTEVSAISFDTRKLTPGSLFACIPGGKADGHDFVHEAKEKGAVVLLVEREGIWPLPSVHVEDVREALALIAANFYSKPSRSLKLIGITGTNGKTTTSFLIKHILEKQGFKVGLIGTIANMIGSRALYTDYTTPDSVTLQELLAQMVKEGVTHIVMEVSSHSLDQKRVSGCHFDVGVFTNLTQDHLDYHHDFDSYMLAKKQLFFISGKGVFNYDDPYTERLIKGVTSTVTTYSTKDDKADVIAKNIKLKPKSVEFEVLTTGNIARAEVNIPGMFTVYNSLAAITACLQMGLPLDAVLSALPSAGGVKGRVEVVDIGNRPYTVIIDYAHTPDGIKNVLSAVRGFAKGRVVTLFGCGGDRDPVKRPMMAKIAAELSDFVIVTSDNPRTENPAKIIEDILVGMEGCKVPYIVEEDRKKAIAYALDHAQPDDLIVLAGKGHETYQILSTGKIHFDEREIVREHLGLS